MIVFGLDLSLLSTGVCILSGDQTSPPQIQTLTLPQPKANTQQEKIERLVSICSQLVRLAKQFNPNAVIIEAPAMNQVWQMAEIGGLHWTVRMQLFLACGIIPDVEQATKLRKHVVGSISFKFDQVTDEAGKKKKKVNYGMVPSKNGKKMRAATIKDVIEMRLKEQGLIFPSQDEMDAYVCARFGWDNLLGRS